MTHCTCGHPKRHHAGNTCAVTTIGGPATPDKYLGAAAQLHMGRTITHCPCTQFSQHTTTSEETTA